VEIDPAALSVFHQNIGDLNVDGNFDVRNLDVEDLQVERTYDTCLMNPPFGSQNKNADRPFIKKSLNIAGVIYSFHLSKTEPFIEQYVEKKGGVIVWKKRYQFIIPRMFFFHTKDESSIEVTCFKFRVQ